MPRPRLSSLVRAGLATVSTARDPVREVVGTRSTTSIPHARSPVTLSGLLVSNLILVRPRAWSISPAASYRRASTDMLRLEPLDRRARDPDQVGRPRGQPRRPPVRHRRCHHDRPGHTRLLVDLTQAKPRAAPPDDVVDPAVRACPAHHAPDHSRFRLLRPTASARTALWAWQSPIGRLPEDPPEPLAAAFSVSTTQELP